MQPPAFLHLQTSVVVVMMIFEFHLFPWLGANTSSRYCLGFWETIITTTTPTTIRSYFGRILNHKKSYPAFFCKLGLVCMEHILARILVVKLKYGPLALTHGHHICVFIRCHSCATSVQLV